MALDTAKPTTPQPPAPAVLATQASAVVHEPPKDTAVPPATVQANVESGRQDIYAQVQSADGRILTGYAANIQQQQQKRHPIAALKKMFGFGQQAEGTNEVEAAPNVTIADVQRHLANLQPHSPDYNTARPDIFSPANESDMAVLRAHADGHANLHLNAHFAHIAARTITRLDEVDGGRFKGHFVIISGLRDVDQQKELQTKYAIYDAQHHVIGYSHPVGSADLSKPHSQHLDGGAFDVAFIGNARDRDAFFTAFHKIGGEEGGRFVKYDINHMGDGFSGNSDILQASAKQGKPSLSAHPTLGT